MLQKFCTPIDPKNKNTVTTSAIALDNENTKINKNQLQNKKITTSRCRVIPDLFARLSTRIVGL